VLVRRLLALVAVLIVLALVAGSIAPVPTPPKPPAPTPRSGDAAAAPGTTTVRAWLSTSASRPARRISARVGDRISITVRGGQADTVALGDLDVEPVERGLPARFDLLADEPGNYPLIALDAQRRIGSLVVR
jgi:hypothetical protein